ncbi:MAG TPA: hypothetical protein PLP14_07030 [Chitinophagaceae bacterium]|nr:hypothetical protein [Chitinophagaceae bacterium]
MNAINKTLPVLLFLLPMSLWAQSGEPVEMAGVLHQNGKIYLVVLVLLTIFAGIIFMLLRLEKRIAQLEKQKESR